MNRTARTLAGIAGIAVLGIVAVGCSSGGSQDNTTRDESGAIVEGGDLGALRIKVGDCFLGLSGSEFSSVAAVPCTESHAHEVYATFMLPDGAWPGVPAVSDAAGEGCLERFEAFVGAPFETSEFGITPVAPTEATWNAINDREVLCLIGNFDGTNKVGTAKDAQR